jgi:hypothetical protein
MVLRNFTESEKKMKITNYRSVKEEVNMTVEAKNSGKPIDAVFGEKLDE